MICRNLIHDKIKKHTAMKKIFLSLLLVLAALPIAAQDEMPLTGGVYAPPPNAAYRLYPTTNIWTFLKLDTRDGRIWQVQYSVDGASHRFETELNSIPCIYSFEERVPGRFALYPTQNMWNFIMLDCTDGRTWQVQWSQDPENRGILYINSLPN